MSREGAKGVVDYLLLAFHAEDFTIDFSVSLMFFLLLLWLPIYPSSMHHKGIHNILAQFHNILHTAGKDQPWGQRRLLLQVLLISFFFQSVYGIHDIHDSLFHRILCNGWDQPLDQLTSFSFPNIHTHKGSRSIQHIHNAPDHMSSSRDQLKDQQQDLLQLPPLAHQRRWLLQTTMPDT